MVHCGAGHSVNLGQQPDKCVCVDFDVYDVQLVRYILCFLCSIINRGRDYLCLYFSLPLLGTSVEFVTC